MFEVFSGNCWVLIAVTFVVMMIFLLVPNGNGFNILRSFSAVVKAFLADSFDEDILKQGNDFKMTKSIQIFFTSLFGSFIFWCFSGILISLLAFPNVDTIRNFDDLLTKPSNFKFITIKGKY